MKHKYLSILMLALAIHIFAVNARLLYHLNPEVNEKVGFSFIDLNEQTILALIFSLAYSSGTVAVLRISKNKKLIAAFIVLDPIAVLLYYFINIPLQIGAVYYAIYTGALIYTFMFLNDTEHLYDKIVEMKKKGYTQRVIGQTLGISESMVSRILSRVNEAEA